MSRKRKKRGTSRKGEAKAAHKAPPSRDGRKSWWLLCGLLVVLAVVVLVQTRPWDTWSASVRPRPDVELTSVSFSAREAKADGRFVALPPEETGIDFVHPIDTSHPKKYLYFSGTTGGGVAIGDIDADGLPDLYLVSGPGQNKLYRQVSPLKFEDVTESAGGLGGGDAWGTGATMADINNDGWLDIYVCHYDAPNLLFINRGDGTFDERSAEWGVNLTDACMLATFADYDRDGDLDMYLLTYRYVRPEGRPSTPPIAMVGGQRRIAQGFEKYYQATEAAPGFAPIARSDGLLRNDGGTFTNVTEETGIYSIGHGLSATWWDYNDDGWPDLYVANDFTDYDRLFLNNGNGTFRDVIREAVPYTSWFSMGADVGDVNNDGRLDLLVADMSATTHYKQKISMGNMEDSRDFLLNAIPRQYMRNTLLLGTGTSRFMEAAYLAGLDSTDWSWTAKLVDLDNDGRQDAFFTNGSPRNFIDADIDFSTDKLIGKTNWDIYAHTPPLKERNLAFRNAGDLRFENVSSGWGLDHEGISMAAAHADLDRDGDLDLVVANLDEPVSIYRNDASHGNSVMIQLEGAASNRYGVGAKLTIETAAGRQIRYHNPVTGFLSSNEPLIHFGLGDAEQIDRLIVEWPSGQRQELRGLAVNQLHVVAELPARDSASAGPSGIIASTRPAPLFEASSTLAAVKHIEQEYDDYRRQPLLPNKLSQLGPGMAWGDVDGDEDDDLFVGGAAGDPGKLMINKGGGKFTRSSNDVFEKDRAHEDMGAVWFDADGDSDLDLYVVSGGVEVEPGDALLADRLYINDGNGVLRRAIDALPDLRSSGSVVCADDFDQDGDVDLFVGGRVIPGQYPLAPESYLLMNDGGKFEEVTDAIAPQLKNSGMVTGGIWSDADRDGWVDLLITYEWGPVRYFRNVQGKLIEQTKSAGLAQRTGWWNSLAPGDFDSDGDTDYVVTNVGLNTKYHASVEKPALLYYGDFDQSGKMQLIEAEFEDETLFPIRGKSCSTNAMPHLADKFNTFRQFAAASLTEIYTDDCLQDAHRFAANSLESGVLINDGGGKFEFQPLPRIAQVTPAMGVAVADVTGDEVPDILLAQNFYHAQPETGRMSGGVGLLLAGQGDGSFAPVWPDESGIVAPGDARSVALIDVNGDGERDVVIANNDAAMQTFVRRARDANAGTAPSMIGD